MTGICCDGESGRDQWSCRESSLIGKGSQVTRFVFGAEVAESASVSWMGWGWCREWISCCEGGWELVGSGSFTVALLVLSVLLGTG